MTRTNFIRLNINDNYLSLGNLFRIIKEESDNYNTFLQSELFSILFNTENIADSTVNNYCTGFRAINPMYKNYFKEIKTKFEKDRTILVETILKILELIENTNYNLKANSIDIINKNSKLNHICNKLYSISKNDSEVDLVLSNELYKCLEQKDLYQFIVKVIFYVVLNKKQPIFVSEKLNNVIEKNIYNTNISVNDIEEFIKIQLNSGVWSVRGITELAKRNNPFACFEIASMEFYGIITGKPRYDMAYKYYQIAAQNNHPVANWAIGYLYYKGNVGSKTKHDLFLALKYFNKAKRLKCSNAFNSLGLIILNGDFPHISKNENKAIDMFNTAISMGNIYAYNNLGKIYENRKDYKKSYEYYITSANLGESWAANKMGDFYRKGIGVKKDLNKSFEYYKIATEASQFTLCPWAKYNLAKYFYKNGNLEINICKDIKKTIELLEDICDNLFEACEELFYIYYELYLETNKTNDYYLEKVLYYKTKCENNEKYNTTIKKNIETKIQKIYNKKSIILPE